MLGQTAMLRDTIRRLDATGVRVLDVEVMRIGPDGLAVDLEVLLDTAARLGARYMLVLSDDSDEMRLADRLAEISTRARSYGLALALEFMPFRGVKDLSAAVRVAELAGQENLRLLVDALHLQRSGGTAKDVSRLDPSAVAYLHLCDAPSTAPHDLATEARSNRLLLGHGDLPLHELVESWPSDLIIGLEIPSEERLSVMGPRRYAAEVVRTAREYLQLGS
jgi:sugar phosphate isomerase/epimerase